MILTILIILLGIALVFVFMNREKDEEKARIGIIALTVAIVALVIVRLVFDAKGPTLAQVDTTLDRSLGAVAADRVAELAQGDTAVIVAALTFDSPFLSARLEGFQEQLGARNIQVVAIEDTHPEELMGNGEAFPEEGLDARSIRIAMDKHPEAEIIISLGGFPLHNFEEIAQDVQRREFFVFEEYTPFNWFPLLQNGAIKAMITQPMDTVWSDTSGTPEQIFDRRYVVVTRENLPSLRNRIDSGDSAW